MYFCPCARANFNMPWSLSVLLWWPNHCWRLSPHRFKFTLVRFCLNYWQICGLDRENRNKVRAGRRINNGSNQNNLGLLSASLSLSLSLRGKTETHRSHAIDVRLTPAKARIPRKCGVFEGAMLAGKDWPESLAKGKAVSSQKFKSPTWSFYAFNLDVCMKIIMTPTCCQRTDGRQQQTTDTANTQLHTVSRHGTVGCRRWDVFFF